MTNQMENRTYLVDKVITNGDFTYPIYFDITRLGNRIYCRSQIDDGISYIDPMTRSDAAKVLNDLRKHKPERIDWSWTR